MTHETVALVRYRLARASEALEEAALLLRMIGDGASYDS
jgi:hypothetical protein